MNVKTVLSWDDVYRRVLGFPVEASIHPYRIYGVPRGGIPVAQAVFHMLARRGIAARIVTDYEEANLVVDDIIDSGATRQRYRKLCPEVPFLALVTRVPGDNAWYVFPWETQAEEMGPEDNIVRMLQFLGEDVKREGLIETPKRVVKSWAEIYSGYQTDPTKILKSFSEGACNEMVVLRDIEFYSTCEHHMQPFFGKAHIGYLPDKRVVGVSKLARLLDAFARRLQIQERIGTQVVESLMGNLQPLGAGCILSAQHFCMCSRGVNKQNSVMVTSALRGRFVAPEVRAEFLRLAGL